MPVLEPIKFVASTESIRIPTPQNVPEETLPKRPIIGDDPLSAFENYHTQIQTDLRGWMTFSVEARIEKAKRFSKLHQSDALKMDEDRRVKILNYIIWMESHHPLGKREPAAVAFNGLFPKNAS